MSIASSLIVEDRAQVDGRRSVREHHTDHVGEVHAIAYLAESGADVSAALAPRAAQLEALLSDRDIQQNVARIMAGDYADVSAQHASLGEIRAAIRALYQTGSGEIIGRLAGFLLTLTDAQLRTLFNMTQAQVNALKTRLQARFNELTAMLAAVGE